MAIKASCGDARRLNLALQGGGAHGAFTWGVLDRLLEDDRLEIDGVSGTSAGAMNAAVLAQGYLEDGREGARRRLAEFWRRVSDEGNFGLIQPGALDRLAGNWNLDSSFAYLFFEQMTRLFSPYQFNPFNLHPLRGILDDMLDLDALRGRSPIKLFVSATNVRTGKIKVFDSTELSVETFLASACLPTLFQAIEIDGEPYWDGGFMGNPAIFPLIYNCQAQDIVIVQINPLNCGEVPQTPAEILNRMNEISFNSSLMREMRAIYFVGRLIEEERLDHNRYKRLKIHMIEAEDTMNRLGYSSKLNADAPFLGFLFDVGRRRTDEWIAANFDRLGRESTVDIASTFL